MFEPAHKSLPPVDYVSMIRSLYADRRVMILGALSSGLVAAVAGVESGSWVLLAVALGFILVGIARDFDMRAFEHAQLDDDDVATAMKWERRSTIGAAAIAVLYAFWMSYSFLVVNTAFAELSSLSVTVSVLVGVAGRNFAIDRLVTTQVAIMSVGMAVGMLFDGAFHTAMLSVVLIAFVFSLRKVSANIRAILLRAVHGRIEATRLASELDTALETMQHGLCMLDEHGLIAVANDRAELVFASFMPGNWAGRPFAAMIAAAAQRGTIPQRSASQLMDTVNGGDGGKVVLKLADGQFCEVTVSSRLDKTVLLFEDITERVKAEERINYMAHYDTLTGLPNRAYFTEQVEADLARRRRSRNGKLANDTAMLMIVDIDDFKHVNDTMGHLIGDRVLIETSERLTRVLGKDSLVARLGGDEYVVYRSGGVALSETVTDPEAILGGFRGPFEVDGEVFAVNVSVGVVTVTDSDEDLDGLMTKADLALYKAKALGKGRSQVFHDEMDTDYRYRQRLKAELKEAVATGGLSLVFQPIVDLQTRRVVSCEALARWHHPELGAIPPSLFIPIAEETGIISEISRWVLATASAECRNWPEEVSVSVNISARDFRNADVAAMVKGALSSSGLAPDRLEIEVTETALIEERTAATKILQKLARQGIGIALDDFGTGYSSLSYLQALPFTKLKIDRSFVMDIVDNPRSLKLLSNVAQLGKDINLTVTAEGVETEEQLNLIAEHSKVDQIQGYLFGVPLPRREVAELIDRMAARSPVALLAVGTESRKRG
ncbi:EAL domain-containing protein [Devosia sp. ZB163]|uniref:putative bifunctional diguanylate cyclase/phosphodiesterase n=1 Tax=Devosia sp. ZB163 TaxID=3025938 RepID=UPI002362F9C9|nr:EAL domain-containing protein [Devosia sp. ZB163]MDC9822205.1 EAL domain-containing protein [Devosia sp. ZB163]